VDRIEILTHKLRVLQDEEQEYYDSIPESLLESPQAKAAEKAIHYLSYASGNLAGAICKILDAKGVKP
jgi:hypothetical protein